MIVGRKITWVLCWLAPYLISGFSAPLIFKRAPTLQIGGHFAGALFIFAAVWALLVSWRHKFPWVACIYFMVFAVLTVSFWAWRFRVATPLAQSHFLGIGGGLWHGGLTIFYLVGGVLMAMLEYKNSNILRE